MNDIMLDNYSNARLSVLEKFCLFFKKVQYELVPSDGEVFRIGSKEIHNKIVCVSIEPCGMMPAIRPSRRRRRKVRERKVYLTISDEVAHDA